MTEQALREKVVGIMESWNGYKESNGTHKKIIDIYNAYTPLPRGYKVQYTDPWCATTTSAAFIKAKLTDIAPPECSCSQLIALYKGLGRWMETDSYVPELGDLVMYDWQDNGVGDNTGNPEHVGMVVSVTGRTIKVIEGNKGNAVGYRTLQVNGKNIRGYCLPDYASKATSNPVGVKMVSVSLPVLKKGSKGAAVKALQELLLAKGYNPQGVDASFGKNTDTALRAYQKASGLAVDGSCGKATWTSLLTK